MAYGIFNVQDRGTMFINPGTEVYAGMVVGQNPKGEDISVNVCKTKHLTNTRASGSDDALRLVPPRILSLEEALEFLAEDEPAGGYPQEHSHPQAPAGPQPADAGVGQEEGRG